MTILGMLLPFAASATPVNCYMVPKAILPITFTSSALHPTIQGSINGSPTPVLVDTGAYKTFLVQSALEKRGIGMRPSTSSAGGVSGRTALFDAQIDKLTVGPASGTGGFEVLQTPRGDFPFGVVVGADFLLRSDVEISFADKHIKFFSPQGCANGFLAYWDPKASVLAFEAPVEGDLRPEVVVKLNGKAVRALIDTGASHSFVDLSAAKRVGITPQSAGVESVGQDVSAIGDAPRRIWRAPFDSFAIGDEQLKNVKLHIVDLGGAGEKVVLGADFLRSHRVLMSMSQRRMYFSYLGGAVFAGESRNGEPWFFGEAISGNRDAQYRMGRALEGASGGGGARAATWFQKAAIQGQPQAQARVARAKFFAGDFAGSAKMYRAALANTEAVDREAEWLYIAATRAGDGARATKELAGTYASIRKQGGENPIMAFLLDPRDRVGILKQAGSALDAGKERYCEAHFFVAQTYLIEKQPDMAHPLLEGARDTCAQDSGEYGGAQAELLRLQARRQRKP